MPEISRFYGIIIMMFADDHNPPHFHVRYGSRAIVTIDKGIVQGQLSRKELNRVFEWLDLHHDELIENWNRLKNGQEPLPIKPLI